MPRKTRSEQHESIIHRLDSSRRWREDQGYDQTWVRMVDLYRGRHWPRTSYNREDLIVVNLAFSTVNVIAPSVSVNHPKVVVAANRPQDQDRAAFVEAVVNHLWRHHDFQAPFKRAVKDFLIFGHGWIKVGWKFLEQERTLNEDERDELFNEAVAEADMFAMDNPEMAADLPTDDDLSANIPTTQMAIVEDQPFVERVSPFDIFVDPEATCMEDAQWIAQRIVRPLEEAQKDRRYKPSVRKRLTADALSSMSDYTDRNQVENYLLDEERVVIYEFYNIAENTMSVCAGNGDEFLVDPTPMPYAYGQPFVMLRNYDIPDHFYPIGDLEAIASLQEELDKTRTQLVNARKRYARKYLFHERSFGPEGREAVASDEDGRLVPVVDENKPLSEVVMPMPQIPLSAEVYNTSAIIEQDINMVSGVSEYARGQMPEIRRTATEASIIADAGNARAADKLAIVELAITHIARRVLQVMQQYMTGEQMARVSTGGEAMYIPYIRDDIVGEYDFAVAAGSTQPMNDTIRRSQAVNLLNAMAPLIGTVIDPAALAVHVLQQGFDVKDPEKFIIQQQPQAPVEGMELPGAGPMGPAPPTDTGIPADILAQLAGENAMGLGNL